MEDWLFYSLTSLLCLVCSLLLRARASAGAEDGAGAGPAAVPRTSTSSRRCGGSRRSTARCSRRAPAPSARRPYGPTWTALRRCISSGVLNPARLRAFSGARRCVLDALVSHVRGEGGAPVTVMEPFRYAMLCLLVHMCFGDRPGDARVREIEALQRELLSNFLSFEVFAFLPPITKLVFRKRWNEMGLTDGEIVSLCSEVKLTIPEDGGRGLTDGEIVSLCSEFMSAGTDTTATALQWILANLVKNPAMQDRLMEEIAAAVAGDGEVREEDLQAMPYLKAVVLEGLRRHPPGHYVLPHAVEDETTLDGYRVPANTPVNFAVREIGLDSEVWTSPEVFRPERFLAGGEGEDVDLTGSKEIKMMPFGAGRRVCPGMALALLHLEYFVANLVWEFDWREVAGDEVDLTEKML
uniref:Cytochrome P450 n=1 Tax=Oryza barthii TaxID=65489 RepID=A0A0D3GWE4_9ORYZ